MDDFQKLEAAKDGLRVQPQSRPLLTIYFDGSGKLHVDVKSNDMDEVARRFFDNIVKPMADRYIEKELASRQKEL